MVLGIGIDLVDVRRFAAALRRHGDRLERRVFTETELADCARRADRALALAARFAAKEACVKALGAAPGLRLRDIEVVRAASGRPELRLHGPAASAAARAGATRAHVSLTHEVSAASAIVVLEDGPPTAGLSPARP
jgi:holo-[acyl-carrier protein] synthase